VVVVGTETDSERRDNRWAIQCPDRGEVSGRQVDPARLVAGAGTQTTGPVSAVLALIAVVRVTAAYVAK
jgi:hypothetical protein